MDFNFSKLNETNFSSNAGAHLKPYEIYNVNLTKIEKTELKGSKDPNAVYPVVALEFTATEDPKGTFTTNLFIPTTQADIERPTFKNAEGHGCSLSGRRFLRAAKHYSIKPKNLISLLKCFIIK